MAISAGDEYPLHQSADWIRHVATGDRNFYDRNYFCMHNSTDELMVIFGMGQYPNLGVHDSFACAAIGDEHHVVRGSRPLTDRLDMSVGPMRIEVLEPLRRVRFVCEPTDHSIAMDVTWEGTTPPHEEPNQFIRHEGRVLFNTQRFAQTGSWSGTLQIGDRSFEVTPDTWKGARDRSWGVRPVGEPQTDGIRQGVNSMAGMWNYMPMDFGDHSIIYMLHEAPDGSRPLEDGVRVWADTSRAPEPLGRPEHEHHFEAGTRVLTGSTIRFPQAGLEIACEPMKVNFVSIGTGYGLDADWRHGMYQGPDLVVQGLTKTVDEVRPLGQYGVVDHAGKFTYDGKVGFGLYEHGFFGPFPPYGLE